MNFVSARDLTSLTPYSDACAADRAIVDKIENEGRAVLQAFLSFARTESMALKHASRERLMDNLSKAFDPDGLASDLFTDGFFETKEFLDDQLLNEREAT